MSADIDLPYLRNGSGGPLVRSLQEQLQRDGFLRNRVDSIFGRRTEQALREFQQGRGIDADGIVGPETWRALAGAGLDLASLEPRRVRRAQPPHPFIRIGSVGPHVGAIRAYLGLADTYVFDVATEEAVCQFQEKAGLAGDGIVGPRTWAALVNSGLDVHDLPPFDQAPTSSSAPQPAPSESRPVTTSTASSWLAGGISTDRVDPTDGIPASQDHLGARVWVSMLATVIVDEATPMPLSVGLFGEWGTGKSYFMGLLRAEVERLAESGRKPYLPRVVQIGFNAWHYADTNLWASLGDEIFRQLAGPETADESRQRLRDELARGSAERQVLAAREEQARTETVRLRAALQEATASREIHAKDLLSAIKESPELAKRLDKVWQRLGISDEVQQARILADQVQGTTQEVGALHSLFSRRRSWILAGICVIALLAVVTAAWIPVDWSKWLAGGGASAIAVALATAVAWLGRAKEGLTQLRTIATDLNRKVEALAKRRTSEAVNDAIDELRRAEASEAVAQAQLDEMSARVKQLAQELADLMPDQRLYAFLAERAGGGQYAGKLGLISTIRKDFEHLVELLQDWHGDAAEGSPPRPIDRIVLYIDDLDRCSPQQVVDVLQAVHLLLALDLFVVVVGVDPRWLRQSLHHQYRGMLNEGTFLPSADQALWNVTPNDYLEKIFNIPFVLPGIPAGGLGRMLRGLAAPGYEAVPSRAAPAQETQAQPVTGADTEIPAAEPAATALSAEPGSELAASQAAEVSDPPRPLTEPELVLLSGLESFVATPREAKRMFNLYRMLRSTRDLSDASAFLGDSTTPGEYQAVALLLGMMTANTDVLRGVLDAEPRAEPPVAGGLNYRPDDSQWLEFVEDIAPEWSDGQWTNQIVGPISPEALPGWQQFAACAAQASKLITLSDLAAFKRWAPRVQRFSFIMSPLNTAGSPQRGGPLPRGLARPALAGHADGGGDDAVGVA
jgi:peptidoglycan hydrolase-like protein with peptidoglycan-binding domain